MMAATVRRLLLVLALAVLASVPAAWADTVTIPSTAGLPWSDPNHKGPLELLASQIASTIAGRAVSLHCEGENDWNTLVTQRSLPSTQLAYIEAFYNPATNTFWSGADTGEFSPTECGNLQDFALAASKPTRCEAQEQKLVYRTVRRKVSVPIRRKGRIVGHRTVWRTRKVPKYVTVQGPPIPCYKGAQMFAADMPSSYWDAYALYAVAIHVLAAESIVFKQVTGGAPVLSGAVANAQAECAGMQWMPYVAEQLGDAPDDAQAIAVYYLDYIYPYRPAESQSPDCVPGGALDVRPAGTTAWP